MIYRNGQYGSVVCYKQDFIQFQAHLVRCNSDIALAEADKVLISGIIILSFSGSIFEEKYVRPYLGSEALSHLPLRASRPEEARLLDQLQAIGRLFQTAGFGYELKVQAAITELWLGLICLSGERAPAAEKGHGTVQEIIRFLRRHYQEEISLEDVGRAVGFSTGECCRLFKRVTGGTIQNYLRSYRLTRSIELLEETELPVSEIALKSCFNGASYYIECFKKELKQTPLKYRRLHRGA